MEEEIQTARRRLFETSLDLSRKRKKAALDLTVQVESELKGLGMGGCQFQMVFSPVTNEREKETDENYLYEGTVLSRAGIEKGEFYIAPNVGEGLRPLARIASGGELSRILLVLKGLLSHQDSLETLIFDEVDSGIGGSLGEAVGRKLSQLSQTHQVVCITHLPQIAAFAETHFQVFKETRDQRTQTKIRLLQEEEQVEEMARMLGGTSSSAKTASVAREMLSRARKYQGLNHDRIFLPALINPKKSRSEPAIDPLALLIPLPADLQRMTRLFGEAGSLCFKNNLLRVFQLRDSSRAIGGGRSGGRGSSGGHDFGKADRPGGPACYLSGLDRRASVRPCLPGDLLLPDEAISEEGTSRHYSDERRSKPSVPCFRI